MSPGRIVVVGGGTAGCVTVSRLAAICDSEIVLVEPGAPSTHDDVPRFFDVLADASLQRIEEVSLTKGSPLVPYLQASALGGGSAINGMLLSGDAPPVASGLVSRVTTSQMGRMGEALVSSGGEAARLWWNEGRWNPGRAAMHLCDEGRVQWVRAIAEGVSFDGDRATGVVTDEGEIEADAVIMCAGALATPAIALRSGAGSMNPMIGLGLQDHPSVTFAVPLDGSNPASFDVTAVKRGRTSSGASFLVVAHERASMFESEYGLLQVMLLDPVSRGSVTWVDGVLRCEFHMLDDQSDVEAMRESVRSLMETVRHRSLAERFPVVHVDSEGRTVDDLHAGSDDDLDAWVRGHLRPVFHAASSCSRAVTLDGAMTGVRGLHVADASALARVPSGTPAADVTIVAERTARAVAEGATR